eukprot:6374697-Alexandrium_andersonii.AAC.1
MSASLVGSEMCIRDSDDAERDADAHADADTDADAIADRESGHRRRHGITVSYTHLTLPTICSV